MVERDVVALAQLWADQFQHMTTLAVAGAGGLLVAVQAGLVKVGPRFWAAIITLIAAAMLGMFGQVTVVDDATKGDPPGRSARIVRAIGFMLFGSGSYFVLRLFV